MPSLWNSEMLLLWLPLLLSCFIVVVFVQQVAMCHDNWLILLNFCWCRSLKSHPNPPRRCLPNDLQIMPSGVPNKLHHSWVMGDGSGVLLRPISMWMKRNLAITHDWASNARQGESIPLPKLPTTSCIPMVPINTALVTIHGWKGLGSHEQQGG